MTDVIDSLCRSTCRYYKTKTTDDGDVSFDGCMRLEADGVPQPNPILICPYRMHRIERRLVEVEKWIEKFNEVILTHGLRIKIPGPVDENKG